MRKKKQPEILDYHHSKLLPAICNACFTTATGRVTSPTPKSNMGTPATSWKWDYWYISECVKEAEFRGDEWNLLPLREIQMRLEKSKCRTVITPCENNLYADYLMHQVTKCPNGAFLFGG